LTATAAPLGTPFRLAINILLYRKKVLSNSRSFFVRNRFSSQIAKHPVRIRADKSIDER
jgi:hypothetical protein